MDQIYAKVKRLRKAPFRRLISDRKLFEMDPPEPSLCREYDPRTLLDDDEWYSVSGFRAREFFPIYLKDETTVSADCPELTKEQFENITLLMSSQNNAFFFQRVRPTSFVKRKCIKFGDAAFIEEASSSRVVINSIPDAIYVPSRDVVMFRDLAAVSPLFQGIDQLFKVATDEQVSEFLDYEFVSASIPVASVAKPNRKRIALALEALGAMSESDRGDVIDYINEYCGEKLEFDEVKRQFKVETDEDLKTLIYGVEQRFYTTPVGAERRLANSVVSLDV
ncbi:ATP F0F1 synthase synthase [Gordonia sp. VNK21]|uniref:ATP F0F1 synthase synthase n=1 Tax=Gordonia sp. VNK21 TaxID=3382483 RepID=UPI0038D45751